MHVEFWYFIQFRPWLLFQEKFPHLVEKRICKLCQFDARTTRDDSEDDDEDDLIWVHLGTIHDKINVVLKVRNLKLESRKNSFSLF